MQNLMNIRQSLTMSSREISELTGKRHPDVKRDIEVMLDQLSEDVSNFARIYFDTMNRKQALRVAARESKYEFGVKA